MPTIVWWEIETPAPEAFQRFHGALWGWTFQPAFADTRLGADYWIVKDDGRSLGGLQRSRSGEPPRAGTRLYVEVDDLEAVLERVRHLGGTVERTRTALGGDDRWFATVLDPAGVSFGLWSANAPRADHASAGVGWSQRLGAVGVWRGVTLVHPTMAETIEGLGYGTVWLGGSPGSDLRTVEQLLDATESLQIATGIVNIWKSDPAELADSYHRIEARHPGRLLLGIGSGHREATPQRERPVEAMVRYLDVLDERAVPVQARVLSALGPRMLALAAERSAGTHPYLTIPAQTRDARATLGPNALVAPEQTVVLDADPESARRIARDFLRSYLGLSNYTTTMRRGGFTPDDIADGGSDALVDTIVAHGDAPVLAAAVRAHLDAGADHVCIQVQPANSDIIPALRTIANELELRPKR